MFRFGEKSMSYLRTVDSSLIEVALRAIEISNKRGGIDFIIIKSGGKRTAEEQAELYAKGVSKCDGYKKKSYHQSGLALDVIAYVDGKASWDRAELNKVAVCMLQAAIELNVKLEWGGSWRNGWDAAHYQIK